MHIPVRWYDMIPINAYWFALTTRSQVLASLVIPLLVQQYVGEGAKGTYVGVIRLWALMAALLVQAFMGLVSDQSTLRWGKRRPFIVAGTIGQLLVISLIGFAAGLEGMTGYWVLFALYILSMVAADTAQAATQGLIPDLFPENQRGRFSGVKALLELPIPLVFTSLVIGKLISAGNLWGALIALMAVLIVCLFVTLFVREEPGNPKTAAPIDWQPIVRLALMTGTFTLVILGTGFLIRLAIRTLPAMATTAKLISMGALGLVGMVVAILLGIWLSIRIGVGKEINRHPSFVWWVILRLAFMVPVTNLGIFLLFFMQERFTEMGLVGAAAPATRAVMWVGVMIVVTAIPGGWLSDRFGKRLLVAFGCLLGGVGTFIVVLASQMTITYVGAGMMGAGIGLFYPANWALGTGLVPAKQAGRYLGISNLAGAGAGAIGGYIGGPIADSANYSLLFALSGILFFLAALPLFGIKNR